MSKEGKELLLFLFHITIMCGIVILFDTTFSYVLNHVILPSLNWFNSLGFIYKLLIILIGGALIFTILLFVFSVIFGMICSIIFDYIPQNQITNIVTIIVVVINAIVCIKELWTSVEHISFWTGAEFLVLSGIILLLMQQIVQATNYKYLIRE